TGMSEEAATKVIKDYLTGKAEMFYRREVVRSREQWSLKDIYLGLFDYCFPDNYKNSLRDNLLSFQQRGLNFIDFVRELENLADKFPDIGHRQRVNILWKGAHRYICAEWTKHDYNPESTRWDKLVARGKQYETANQLYRQGDTYPRNEKFMNQGYVKPIMKEKLKPGIETRIKSGGRIARSEKLSQNNGPKLTKEEVNQLRAEGRCFNCKKET
ncbi:MAG TPA: hypothetical protein VGO47_11295, partial [Chlamydiales bacterium]|nr:hypothetical protein [Chlamydiales bacterium]